MMTDFFGENFGHKTILFDVFDKEKHLVWTRKYIDHRHCHCWKKKEEHKQNSISIDGQSSIKLWEEN